VQRVSQRVRNGCVIELYCDTGEHFEERLALRLCDETSGLGARHDVADLEGPSHGDAGREIRVAQSIEHGLRVGAIDGLAVTEQPGHRH